MCFFFSFEKVNEGLQKDFLRPGRPHESDKPLQLNHNLPTQFHNLK